MKRFLIAVFFVGVIVLAGATGLGFYRGWFTFAVDKDKFEADKEKVEQKVDDLTHPSKNKATTPGSPQKQE